MTITDSKQDYSERNLAEIPYANNVEDFTDTVRSLVNDESTLFLNAQTNPEMSPNQSIHFIKGSDSRSDVARAIEGEVFLRDWEQLPSVTAQDMAAIENNSAFFVMIEQTDTGPKTVGALRVAVARDPSDITETKQFFTKSYPGAALPEALDRQEGEEVLWDIVSVVTDSEHRDGKASNWLYHALYKKSCDLGIPHWISNIHDKEFRNLDMLGIPFQLIEETEKVTVPAGKKVLKFGFYTLNVADIRPNMEKKIAEFEALNGDDQMAKFRKLIASMSRIAINGSTE